MTRKRTWPRSPSFSRSMRKPFAARTIRPCCDCVLTSRRNPNRSAFGGGCRGDFRRNLHQESAMSTDRPTQSDKELWQSLATGRDAASWVVKAPVSDLDFAAWLEGRMSEEAAARIEAAVATDPELRRAALELSE